MQLKARFRFSIIDFVNSICALMLICRYAFTLIMRYDSSVVIKYGIAMLWLLTACVNDKKLISKSRRIIILMLIILFLNVLLYFTSGSTYNLIRFRSQTFFFFFWIIMFEYYKDRNINVERIALVFMPLFLLSCYYTITGNLSYVHASRQLAGLAGSQQIALYYKAHIGGYGFIYFIAFMIPMLFLAYKTRFNRHISIIYLIAVVISFVTIIISDYTTALLVGAFLLIYSLFFTNSKYKYLYTTIIVFLIIAGAIFGNVILNYLKDFFNGINSYMIVKRIEQLQLAATQEGETLYRIELYRNGLLNFWDRPIWGVPQDSEVLRYSNHSEVICYLERFGVFGLIYPFVLFADYRNAYNSLNNPIYKSFYRAIMIMLLIFAIINRVDTAPEISLAVYLIIPLTLIYMERQLPLKATELERAE